MPLNPVLFKSYKTPLLCVLLSTIFYGSFAYDLVRTDATKLILLYGGLFVFAGILKKTIGLNAANTQATNLRFLVLSAIVFRLVFLVAIPNLSQDFYRFIWDGRLLFQSFNPYLYTPESFIQNGKFPIAQAQDLYNGMGALNASHFTNYPPLKQLCFYIAALFSGNSILGSVVVIRVLISAADIGTLYFGSKLLERLKLPSSRIWWYILNPFIIIELTGNLHFEGLMIFFLVWSLYLLHSGKWKWAAVVFACSISVKLVPLMFLPLFYGWFKRLSVISSKSDKSQNVLKTISNYSPNTCIRQAKSKGLDALTGLKKLISFYAIIGLTTAILFLPFLSMEFINNYSQTVGLWFGDFEFNASVYYLAREIGYVITGYNEIAIISKILSAVTLLIILGFSIFKTNTSIPKLTTSILLSFTFYLFLSTTVHPWYIATLVILCIFTNYRFPLVWSFVIVLSYSAYLGTSSADKSENLWIIALEYGIVFSVFVWEVLQKKRLPIS